MRISDHIVGGHIVVGYIRHRWRREHEFARHRHPHSDALHLIERFRRRDAGHLEIEVTVDDPKTYTKPIIFTVKTTWSLTKICWNTSAATTKRTSSISNDSRGATVIVMPVRRVSHLITGPISRRTATSCR